MKPALTWSVRATRLAAYACGRDEIVREVVSERKGLVDKMHAKSKEWPLTVQACIDVMDYFSVGIKQVYLGIREIPIP